MSDPTTATDETTVTFSVKSGSQKWTLSLPLATTAADLKAKLAGEDFANVPASAQRLIYSGKVLKDTDTLGTHNVKDGNTMHLVKSAASNQRQAPASQSSTIPNAGTPQNTGVPQNLASGTGNDPLAGLTGARYAGFAGLPSLDSLANPPTPEDMIRRLQDPNFAQQMNEALQNPQMIDMMINSNPQLRAMGPQARQLLQSDYFRRMMTNPEALQSMMQLQNAMGGDPFGRPGVPGESAFPAPGITNPSEQQQPAQTEGQGQNQNQTQNQNRQQALFDFLGGMHGNPAGGPRAGNVADQQNPFLAFLNPPAGAGQTPTAGTGQGQNAGDTNPNTANPPAGIPGLDQLLFPPGNNGQPNPMADMYNRMVADRLANPNAAPGQNVPPMDFNSLFGNLGGPPQAPDNRPPEERYATQLRQLNEMGFHDFDRNVMALSRSGGDVNGALEFLFSQP